MNLNNKKVVYYFCCNAFIDPVASLVFSALDHWLPLKTLSKSVDGYPVKFLEDSNNAFFFVRTTDVISHDYLKYLSVMNEWFGDFDFAGVVNWHEGKNAPDRILTVHTTGDVVSGHFGLANPLYTRNLLIALEDHRERLGLDTFSVSTEATHWSGIVYGGNPELITRYAVPLVDVEIGSSHESWSNPLAVEAVSRSLMDVFSNNNEILSLLCVGGVHIESSFASAVLNTMSKTRLAVSHILANHWIVAGNYEDESGLSKLELSIRSIVGKQIEGIVYHNSIKSIYKQQARLLGEKLGIPVFKHKDLSNISLTETVKNFV